MDSYIETVISNFRAISIGLTLIIFAFIILCRAYRKKWKWSEIGWGLNDYVQALLSSYTIPTGLLIAICCTNADKLARATDVWLYLFMAGGALVYTSVSTIISHISRN